MRTPLEYFEARLKEAEGRYVTVEREKLESVLTDYKAVLRVLESNKRYLIRDQG